MGTTASAGAVLQRERESGSSKDPYAVAVQNISLTVGHIPRTIFLPVARMITGASITQTGKSMVKISTVLK